jgi:hypothetical protein
MGILKVYLASPYSSPMPDEAKEDGHLRRQILGTRYHAAVEAAAYLFRRGYAVYSPIASWHTAATKYNLPKEYKIWERADDTFLNWCDAFVILKWKGWCHSTGVLKEREKAEALGKTIGYLGISKTDPDYRLILPTEDD